MYLALVAISFIVTMVLIIKTKFINILKEGIDEVGVFAVLLIVLSAFISSFTIFLGPIVIIMYNLTINKKEKDEKN